MTELTLSGTVVYGDEFEEMAGYVVIEDGKLKEIGEGQIESAVEGVIIPSFVNAHTHIGDSVAKEPDFMPLENLVGRFRDERCHCRHFCYRYTDVRGFP
jgi:cytosine/adenosine deaminase-related metal-dependent hydrolase